MAKAWIALVGLLFICCWSSTMGAEEHVLYKDPTKPVDKRVKDLLKRMTLEEKIGQMVQLERTNMTAEIMRKYYIGMTAEILKMHAYCSCFSAFKRF
jgi:beta-glucosidase